MTPISALWRRFLAAVVGCLLLAGGQLPSARAEAMLQLFNVSWSEVARKMPELAEAGYGSLWLPPPAKGSGGLSVGYDHWDPFDLGSKDQRNTVRTRYGTEAELLHMIEVAHRFGIRVYFDNIMNHRAFDVPGYNESTPIDVYPGMVPEDFHLRKTEDGFYRKWDNTRSWSDAWQVMNLGLSDLIDIAHETPNANFGMTEGSTHPKPSLVRHPNNPEYYAFNSSGQYVGFGNVTAQDMAANPGAFKEDVGGYLIRSVRWFMDRTKADGLRLDAVKHVPDYFFGKMSGADKDTSDAGYLGQVQRQFNLTRGFSDTNHRDSVFEDKLRRDDAMLFGEHLGQPPGYGGYWDAGMRLVDNELRSKLNGVLGNQWAGLQGLDSPGGGGFAASLGVAHANSHDNDYAAQKEWQHAFYMFREGMGLIYSDGYYQAETLGESGGAFPRHANTCYLGQFGDPRIPNILKIHNDLARGLQQGRWSDGDYLAFERRDNRDKLGNTRSGTASEEITMVAMFNDNTAQGQARPIATSFAPGAYLYQYAEGPNGSYMGGFYKYAWELGNVVVPPGGYYVFGWRTPELSSLWPDGAINFYQNGQEVPRISVTRKDGPDGDENFNPLGLSNRGYPAGTTPDKYSYRTTVPVVKEGPVTILARADGSAENILLKLDGGVDLNGGVPAGVSDTAANRDNPPAFSSDIWSGYEQPIFLERQNPEKFAAANTVRCKIGSPGAETYIKTIGGGVSVNNGNAVNDYGTEGGNVAGFLYHDPTADVGGVSNPPKQFDESGSDIVIWAKSNSVGDGFKMFVYYTTDGTFPEGAGGIGHGTTKVAALNWRHDQTGGDPGAWWGSASIPKPSAGATFTYKVGIYRGGAASWWPSGPTQVAYKKKMMTTFRVADFNPATVVFHPHNDYGATQTGLSEGFHVLRARAFLNRDPNVSAPLYQTFTQTFYYDKQTPTGEILYPASNGDTVGGSSYEFVLRTDATVEEVWFHIADSDIGNDDAQTKSVNGNGTGFEPFVDANNNETYDAGEEFTDTNGNGTYDASIPSAWGQATNSTSVNLPGAQKEWRFRYNNIPSSGTAAVTVRLLEASSSRNTTLDASTAHVTEVVRTVQTRGPDERVMIAWPQRDGSTVDDNYIMKVYFTQALADGTTTESLKQRFTFSIASTESGSDRNAVVQSRDNFQINYGVEGGQYHELAIPLPNLYNDVPDFLHTLKVVYTFPDNRQLEAVRLVKANPSTKPFVRITRPSEVGSDGKQTEIILPDGPGPDAMNYTVRVEATATVPDNGLTLSGQPGITLFEEPFTDTNGNGKWDDIEQSTDMNGNGVWDPTDTYTDSNSNNQWDVGEPLLIDHDNDGVWDAGEEFTDLNNDQIGQPNELFADLNGNKVRDAAEAFEDTNGNGEREGTKITVNGNTKTWDFTWRITAPGNYLLTATANLNGQQTSTVRNARVILRQIVDSDLIQDDDDDHDGLADIDETNKKKLPDGNAETWNNGDVHVWYAYGQTLPTSPDTDSDGLPDGLEVGWRTAGTNTVTTIDTNGDGIPNFIGDLDPPLYAVLEHAGYVPGVGDASKGDNRTRQAAGSVTDPAKPDTDNDGILDGVEDANRNGWTDGDGKVLPLTATRTQYAAARPNTGDWPNNFIDSFEIWTETSPTKADSDGDNLSDGYGEDKNGNGFIDGDTNKNRVHNSGEQWSETDPLKPDTDGDGLPDGWEVQYGLDPLDNGSFSKRLDGQGDINNGPDGNPDGDLANNLQEFNSGTNPTRDDRTPPVTGEGSINIGTFTGWNHNDLLVLDEYDENPSNGGGDVFRSWNDTDRSRDILAFSFRDGGDVAAGGDGLVYFRIDFMDLAANAWQGEVDAYIVIDTGNPAGGERAMPNEVDIATDMKWEAVVAVYGQDFGTIFVDRSPSNTTTQFQNPVTEGGVEPRSFGGDNRAAWSSAYDAVEIAIERRHLKDAGWLGDPNTLNFQVFTTKPNTQSGGTGDLASRNDIRDTIYDDWIASDYWKDQDNIILNGKLAGYFGRSTANDRNKSAKVMLLAHGNQAIQPASVTQKLVHDGAATNPAGYFRLIKTHEDYNAPLTLHLTPTLASALQWAANPSPGVWPNNDGPTLNQRIEALVASNRIDLVGSTFSDHIPKYFQQDFNNSNKALAEQFIDGIYGTNSASRSIFWAPERVLDTTSLATIDSMGYSYVFADQMKHFVKWFGRTPALGTEGYRINEVNGMKIFPIHDVTSAYLDQTLDGGSSLPVRQLLSRRSRSGVQDQVAVLWRDMGDFASDAKATSYDSNVRWLSSRPWIRVVTAQQIADNQISYPGQDGNTYTTWGSIPRGTGQTLAQTAKDWVDHATQGNYDNWYHGSDKEEGLKNRTFGASAVFGQVGVNGHANEAWLAANNAYRSNLRQVAAAVIHGAMFQTAFHNTTNNDLSKFSTGEYINPDNDSDQKLADFARNTQAQARFANIYGRVQTWAATPTLGATAEDVDLDGVNEYLLYNNRVFAVFEKKGGRMTAAWLRDPDPSSGNVWQVAGNFASYSNTDTEDEGESNFVTGTTTVKAYRTSGFKDWWTITGVNGSNTAVNADYTVTPAAGGTGWTFSQGGISKTITLADASTGNLTAAYTLTGPSKLYVRFGLAPNLLDMMLHGQANLQTSTVGSTRLNLLNNGPDGPVRAFVETAEGGVVNTGATDKDAAGFTTVNMRNQAQTQQVEVEITGSAIVTLGFDQGDNPDTDGDGLPDSWENDKFGNLGQTGSGDPDGDGLSNSKEYVLGSNPNDAASGRPVTVRDANGYHVTFPTATGRTYVVKYRDDIASGTWTAVSSLGSNQANPVSGDNTSKTVTDTSAGSAMKRFYRVEASVP